MIETKQAIEEKRIIHEKKLSWHIQLIRTHIPKKMVRNPVTEI